MENNSHFLVEPVVKKLSEDEIIEQNRIIKENDAINAYYFLFNKPFSDKDSLMKVILNSSDARVIYETALYIDDAPIAELYNAMKATKNYYFTTLFELEVLA